MADLIGPARCLVCGSGSARASVMKTQRVCIVCNGCKSQVFARGDDSDDLLRRTITGHADRRAPAPADPPTTPPPPAAPPPAPVARSWGLF